MSRWRLYHPASLRLALARPVGVLYGRVPDLSGLLDVLREPAAAPGRLVGTSVLPCQPGLTTGAGAAPTTEALARPAYESVRAAIPGLIADLLLQH